MRKSLFTLLFIACATTSFAQSTETLLLEGWRFQKGAANGAEATDFNDSKWQSVTVPHDWAIAGPFDKDIDKQVVRIEQNGEKEATEKTGRSGSLPWIGEGWYRTSITIPEGYASAELIFDGAMSEPHVWVNGVDAGYWAYGYNVFKLDITKATNGCKAGTYPLAVHLQNKEESSRWYPGAGIFRPVRLVLHKEKYLTTWGTFSRTTMLSGINANATQAKEARLQVTAEATVSTHKGLKVAHILKDASGNVVAQSERELNDTKIAESVLIVRDAKLWSPEHPELYDIKVGGLTVAHGFRQIEFTHIMENVVYNELRKQGYTVDVGSVESFKRDENGKLQRRNLEIDFVVNRHDERLYIQSAFALPDKEKVDQEQASLLNVNDGFRKLIIVGDRYRSGYNEEGILMMSLSDFLLGKE